MPSLTEVDSNHVTRLLDAATDGDSGAARDLLPIVYGELRRAAKLQMAKLPRGQTLQPTALVHEAYLRLVVGAERGDVSWANRRHFFVAAATAMRDILVERARQRASLKRGGDRCRVDLSHVEEPEPHSEHSTVDLVLISEAVSRLSARDVRKGEIVMLRYFAGLSVDETARAMNLSVSTVKREWSFTKALLYDELRHGIEP